MNEVLGRENLAQFVASIKGLLLLFIITRGQHTLNLSAHASHSTSSDDAFWGSAYAHHDVDAVLGLILGRCHSTSDVTVVN